MQCTGPSLNTKFRIRTLVSGFNDSKLVTLGTYVRYKNVKEIKDDPVFLNGRISNTGEKESNNKKMTINKQMT